MPKAQGRKALPVCFLSNSFRARCSRWRFRRPPPISAFGSFATFNYGNETEARDAVTQLGTL